MNVLQVIDTLQVGGAEKITVLLSNLLHRKGVTTSVLILRKEGDLLQELDPDIKRFFLNRTQRYSISKLKETASIVSKYDIVHIHLKHNYRYVALACLLFGVTKPKLLLHDHSHTLRIEKRSRRALKDWFFKNIFKPKYYIGVQKEQLDWAQKKLNIGSNHCFLLENVVVKQEHNIPIEEQSGVVMVGNISRIKNYEFALKLIHKTNHTLTIFGNVVDSVYLSELKKEIENLGLTHKVQFIEKVTDVQPYLSKFKFALHTSKKETGPLVLIEYLAHHLPFVSNATGQVYEKTKNEIPGCYSLGFKETDWLQKIDNLHLIPKEKLTQCYTDNFSSENYIETCLNLYKKILRF